MNTPICTGLNSYLRDGIEIQQVVGSNVFLSQAPPTANLGDYITFLCVSDVPLNQTHDGEATLWRARVQIEGWSANPDTADLIRQAIMSRLNNLYFGGDMGGITVQSAAIAGKRGVLLDVQSGRWRTPLDYFISYEAAT